MSKRLVAFLDPNPDVKAFIQPSLSAAAKFLPVIRGDALPEVGDRLFDQQVSAQERASHGAQRRENGADPSPIVRSKGKERAWR